MAVGKKGYKRMNDRIQQVARAAGVDYLSDQDLERFAQLIVAECAGLVDHVRMEDGTTRGEFIRKYFGVAE
jgi:hypothetical protein